MCGQCHASPGPVQSSLRDPVTVSVDKLSMNYLCSGREGSPFSEPQVAHWIQIHLGIGYQRRQPDRSVAGGWDGRGGRKAQPPLLAPFLHIVPAAAGWEKPVSSQAGQVLLGPREGAQNPHTRSFRHFRAHGGRAPGRSRAANK